tara:strand:+ start:23 stop:340 length:318 start_codon:yes stop_codon:yes gene_type:complete
VPRQIKHRGFDILSFCWDPSSDESTICYCSSTFLTIPPIKVVEGYFIDQYNVILFLGIWILEAELQEMQGKGIKVLMFYADSLPPLMLELIAWRADVIGGKKSVA